MAEENIASGQQRNEPESTEEDHVYIYLEVDDSDEKTPDVQSDSKIKPEEKNADCSTDQLTVNSLTNFQASRYDVFVIETSLDPPAGIS